MSWRVSDSDYALSFKMLKTTTLSLAAAIAAFLGSALPGGAASFTFAL
jgi:hypothetical protein